MSPSKNSSSNTETKLQRKRMFVSRMIQGRLLLRLVGIWLVYHFVLLGTMFLYHYLRYFGDTLTGGPHQTFDELWSAFTTQNFSLVLCALAVFPLVLWDAVKTTHRVAGPLVRFQNALRDLAHGKRVEPIKLRKGDLTIELQDAFNEYLAALDEQAHAAPSSASEARATEEDVEQRLARLDEEVSAVLANEGASREERPAGV